ncbi:MAG: hypothetical protein A2Y17_00430 [Clostridiales bacterium GWF2_38_85]|nr:MAG: hypothetical protein A2Y17_00430 [Clostridiales bacterium GWF2_38_85]HBL83540.1 hypothetical protein [Clostridiales bacterium]
MYDNEKWKKYNELTKNSPPRQMVVKAVELFGDFVGNAIDIGSGAGNDSIYLINYNWNVLAVDKSSNGFDNIKNNLSNEQKIKFSSKQITFEELDVLPKCDLINSSFSIPFCQPAYFNKFLDVIKNSISVNGRFAGNFFGKNDGWSKSDQMSFCSIEDVRNIFSDFEVEFIEEKEYDGKTAAGNDKHWNIINLVARKK